MNFKIVVPIRNGARWLSPILTAYRALDLEPLYIADLRSTDATIDILRDRKADFRLFNGTTNVVEGGALPFAAASMPDDCPWTLRLDDDEFPSVELVDWVRGNEKEARDQWILSRREILNIDNAFKYNRYWSWYHDVSRADFLNGQLRLYKHAKAKFNPTIHYSGIETLQPGYASQEYYFIHLDTILRGLSERIEKIRMYESDYPGSTWRFGNHYLPELCPRDDLNAAPLGTNEFDTLFAALPLAAEEPTVTLTPEEIRLVRSGLFSRENYLRDIAVHEALKQREAALARSHERGLAIRPVGEFCCSVSRILERVPGLSGPADALHALGAKIQHQADLRAADSRGGVNDQTRARP